MVRNTNRIIFMAWVNFSSYFVDMARHPPGTNVYVYLLISSSRIYALTMLCQMALPPAACCFYQLAKGPIAHLGVPPKGHAEKIQR